MFLLQQSENIWVIFSSSKHERRNWGEASFINAPIFSVSQTDTQDLFWRMRKTLQMFMMRGLLVDILDMSSEHIVTFVTFLGANFFAHPGWWTEPYTLSSHGKGDPLSSGIWHWSVRRGTKTFWQWNDQAVNTWCCSVLQCFAVFLFPKHLVGGLEHLLFFHRDILLYNIY